VSESDSFIDEVTDEVRRDKLFALYRKYGWIGIAAVLLIVGGASWNEWQKARAEAAAQAFGDQVAAALGTEDAAARAAALAAVDAGGEPGRAAVLSFLTAAEAEAAGDTGTALAALRTVADDATLPEAYRQLAQLKSVILGGGRMDPAARDQTLAALAVPGSPYRTLAEEQQALAMIDAGKIDEAAGLLTRIRDDAETTAAQKARIEQILVVIGKGGATVEG
jgi:hypothetical protein